MRPAAAREAEEEMNYPIHLASSVFDLMQKNRLKLIQAAEARGLNTPNGQVLLRLAQMLEEGKDAMKDTFAKAISSWQRDEL